ncbi:Copper-transporting ATPase, partial [Perkinsus chesapeaki]
MSAEPSSSAETVTQVRVANLCCALEADLVSDVLRPLPGVRRVTVNTVTKIATVEHDSELISPVEICNLLNTKLLGASLVHTGLEGASEASALKGMRRKAGLQAVLIVLQVGAIVWGALVPLIIAFCLSFSLFLSFARALMMRKFSDVSVFLGVSLRTRKIFGMSGHRNAMDRAVLVGAIVNLSGLLQSCMGIRVTASLAGIMATTETPTATLADSRKLVQVEDLEVGDRILVRTGDSIPADGKVIDGSASVDESRLTGESIPVYKSKGSEVYSGTLVVKGALPCVEVTSRVGRTQKVTDLIQEATAQRTPLQDTVDTFAKYYTPLVVIIFLAIGIYCWSLERGLIVLVAACPCSIVMAAPVAYMTAIVTGVRQYYGTVLKSPTVIEVLAKIQLVAFDKTGTLTQ